MIWFVYVPRRITFNDPWVSGTVTNTMRHMARTRDNCVRNIHSCEPMSEHRFYTPQHAVRVRLERT